MQVLVTYESKHGGTAEIAQVIGQELRESGHEVAVVPMGQVAEILPFDAIVLGSAVYYGRWRGGARRFLKRFQGTLPTRPLWVFESGPLDDSADENRAKPVHATAEQTILLHARDHVVFGGRLAQEDAGPMIRRMMASGKAGQFGDHRNMARVRAWAHTIDSSLKSQGGEIRLPYVVDDSETSAPHSTAVAMSVKLQRTVQRFRRA